jgi:hypothetical protein
MESRSVTDFIFIGTAIRYLQDIAPGTAEIGDAWYDGNYDQLRQWLEGNHLYVSWRAAYMLLNEPIEELKGLERNEKGKVKVSVDLANRIREGAERLRETIDAETIDFYAYVVTDKRYPADSLLHKPSSLMAPGVFDSLSTTVQYDFVQACRAIAFELPTAAGFHLMRGTEGFLRDFYCSIIKRDRVNPLLWGPMVAGLRKRKTSPPPAVLLNNLENLRVSFRNPTQHPDKIYDIHEVQDLLSLCIDVMNRMAKHMSQ